MKEKRSNIGLYFIFRNGCPLKIKNMENGWGLLSEKRIRDADKGIADIWDILLPDF